MIRVVAKGRGLTSVADLAKARGREADALRVVDELDLSDNRIDSLLFEFRVSAPGSDESSSTSTQLSGAQGCPTDETHLHETKSSALSAFHSLQKLQLRSNRLGRTSLLGIGAISSTLCVLDVSHNALESIRGLSGCVALTSLDVSHNRLQRLDELPSAASTQAGGTLAIVASDNRIASASRLESDLMRVSQVLTAIDVSRNLLESAPGALIGITATGPVPFAGAQEGAGDASIRSDAPQGERFPFLAKVDVSLNPFLINGKMEALVDCVAQGAATWLDKREDLKVVDMAVGMSCIEWCRSVDAVVLRQQQGSEKGLRREPQRVVVADGRREEDESTWRASLPRKMASTRKSAQIAAAARQADDDSALTHSEVQVSGEGRISAYRHQPHSAGAFIATTAKGALQQFLAASSSASLNSSSRRSSPKRMDHHEKDMEPSFQSARSVSHHSYTSSRAVDAAHVEHISIVDQSVAQQTNEFLRKENKRLQRQLQDVSRIQREQMQTIRELQADHAKDLDVIQDLQDRLKRKSVELTCMTKRAHDAESASVATHAARDVSGRSNTSGAAAGGVAGRTPVVRVGEENFVNASVMEGRVFHMSSHDRARLIESRALSKHLSLSFDDSGKLLPGRYAHAHRSYVYQEDLAVPAEERIRLQSIASKHNIEHNKHRSTKSGADQSTLSLIKSGDAHIGDDGDQLRDEVLFMSLMDRVHQLEAMYDAQTEYCDDLSHENDELISKYEALIAASSGVLSTSHT